MDVVRLSPQEEARFEQLAAETRKKVFNLAYRLSLDRQDAEDLTQEAYFRAYRSFQDYEGDRPFENWIFRIVTRLFLDLNRARRRRVQTVSFDGPKRGDFADDPTVIESADKSPTADQILLGSTMSMEMEEALAELRPEQRELVRLADVDEVPYQEIAQRVGVPVGTVRSRLHRAHKKLREHLTTRPACTIRCVGCSCVAA